MTASLVLTLTLLAAQSTETPVAPPAEAPAKAQQMVTRQDLAERVQQLDALLAGPIISGELAGEALRAANQRFDRISLQFFGGDLAVVHGALTEWVQELTGGPVATTVRAPGAGKLAAARAEIEAQLAAAKGVDEPSLRVLRARLDLLVDAASPERSREFLLATPALADAVRKEATRLLAGERPYERVAGDLWRTVAHKRRDLAVRVYMPSAPRLEPWPLVVAFHGAGGDENFLFELAGDGYLKRLADEHGFVVVCPMTSDFALSAPAFDALLADLARDYPLDLSRVWLFGHSMGAGAVSNLCRLRPAAIAKAVCVAGFGGVEPASPPVLVLAGELDPIAPPARLERGVEAARAAGADVGYEVLAGQGHTLLLPAALRRAVTFWFAE